MKTPTPTAPRAGTPRLVLSRGMKVAVAGLSVMPLVGALADGVLSWGETTALVIIVLVAIGVVFVGLTRILLRRLSRSRESVVRKGFSRALRVMTASLILGYVALVAGLTLYGDDLPWFLWIALVVWVIGMLGLTILQSRAENLRSEKARPRAEFGFYTSMFVIGVGILGLGASTIGLAINALRGGDVFVFATVGVEALALAGLGIVLLIARHSVVALALLGVGVMVIGFGVGSIVGGDALFGAGVIAVGGATLLSSAATLKLADPWTALAYLVTGAAALFAAFTSWNEREWVLAFALGLVGIVLCTATVFALSITDRDMAQLFRYPANVKVWSRTRYMIILVLAAIAVAASSGWLVNTWRDGRGPGLFAVGGITLGLFAVEVALIVALARRPAPPAMAPRGATPRARARTPRPEATPAAATRQDAPLRS